jgi:hypothetical protein
MIRTLLNKWFDILLGAGFLVILYMIGWLFMVGWLQVNLP